MQEGCRDIETDQASSRLVLLSRSAVRQKSTSFGLRLPLLRTFGDFYRLVLKGPVFCAPAAGAARPRDPPGQRKYCTSSRHAPNDILGGAQQHEIELDADRPLNSCQCGSPNSKPAIKF